MIPKPITSHLVPAQKIFQSVSAASRQTNQAALESVRLSNRILFSEGPLSSHYANTVTVQQIDHFASHGPRMCLISIHKSRELSFSRLWKMEKQACWTICVILQRGSETHFVLFFFFFLARENSAQKFLPRGSLRGRAKVQTNTQLESLISSFAAFPKCDRKMEISPFKVKKRENGEGVEITYPLKQKRRNRLRNR